MTGRTGITRWLGLYLSDWPGRSITWLVNETLKSLRMLLSCSTSVGSIPGTGIHNIGK